MLPSSRFRTLWTQRAFLAQVAAKFRLQPLAAGLTRRILNRSPYPLPPVVILQLTEACNLRCKMCYEWGRTGTQLQEGREGPATLALEVVESLLDECRPQRPFYSLFGGEPLLYPGFERMLERAKKNGSCMETVTNGTLLSRNAAMLTELGMDLVRVSLDGPREVNDEQRGRGTTDRVLAGLEALYLEKQRTRRHSPLLGVICTVTLDNWHSLERLFCRELDLRLLDLVTLQMQTFVTREMGLAYEKVLEREFGCAGASVWRGMLRDPAEFTALDLGEMLRQAGRVRAKLLQNGIPTLLFPNTWTEENLSMYLGARWAKMRDWKGHCIAPWVVTDVTARGEVAPCHIFYDLTVGKLGDQGLRAVWNGEAFDRFRKYMQKRLLPICPACCQYYGYP